MSLEVSAEIANSDEAVKNFAGLIFQHNNYTLQVYKTKQKQTLVIHKTVHILAVPVLYCLEKHISFFE